MPQVLSAEQLEAFVESGYCVLPGAYSADAARALAEYVWHRIEESTEIRRSDSQTWPRHYYLPPAVPNEAAFACMTPTLAHAMEELIGPYDREHLRWNFPINFTIANRKAGDAPSGGWHIDGKWENNTLDHLPVSLLVVGLVTDIEPGFGGTVFAVDSHKHCARVIAESGGALARHELFRALLKEPIGNFCEINGRAGDAILAHPLLLHTTGYNCFGPPRIINAIRARTLSPLRLEGPDDGLTPLELSIREALRETPSSPAAARACQPMAD
jgi:hypothetical protein